jgi:type I restriction enzyme R subunit
MCPRNFTESIVENTALAWFEAGAHAPLHGADIAAGEPGAECSDLTCRDVLPETSIPGELRVVNADQFLREAV